MRFSASKESHLCSGIFSDLNRDLSRHWSILTKASCLTFGSTLRTFCLLCVVFAQSFTKNSFIKWSPFLCGFSTNLTCCFLTFSLHLSLYWRGLSCLLWAFFTNNWTFGAHSLFGKPLKLPFWQEEQSRYFFAYLAPFGRGKVEPVQRVLFSLWKGQRTLFSPPSRHGENVPICAFSKFLHLRWSNKKISIRWCLWRW